MRDAMIVAVIVGAVAGSSATALLTFAIWLVQS